ncbi:MAG: alginate lyase family protein [Gemmatimonadaceae bacterium]
MIRTQWRVAAIAIVAAHLGACAPRAGAEVPLGQRGPGANVITLRADALAQAKARLAAKDTLLAPAFAKLIRDANKALVAPIVAVTDKHTMLPPSGNKHDYYSLSPYWWPDPSKADGLPYIRRDGVTNPESKRDLDQPRVAEMGGNVQALALAWYFTGDERYATRAAKQLRAWFLDSATAMTPHLRFAQLVRGNPEERGSGIIDTRWFIEAADGARLLAGSKSWSAADDAALRKWFTQYVAWLRTSKNGVHEHAARNNHGSWYAAQVASLALFTGDSATARSLAEEGKARIGWQIMPNGDQPLELERTRSLHYSSFNIEALSRLAEVGRKVGVDLWHYQAPEGGSLRIAIDHLAQFAADPKSWTGPQIDEAPTELFVIHLRRGDTVFPDAPYLALLRKLPPDDVQRDRSALLYPDPAR